MNRTMKQYYNITVFLLLWTIGSLCAVFLFWPESGLGVLNKSAFKQKNSIDESVTQALDKPNIVWWTENFPGLNGVLKCATMTNITCNLIQNTNTVAQYHVGAYMFYGSTINSSHLPLPRKPAEVIWGLYHEESPRNILELMHEPALNLFNFSSTFSRYSNVPYPLQYLESINDVTNTEFFVTTSEKNKMLNDIAPIMYLQSDCDTTTERDKYVMELMKYIKIDSYGACLHNKDLPDYVPNNKEDYLNSLNNDNLLKLVAKYKFVIAIENGVCEDYITEKLWRPIKAGSVPIYFGSPSIRDWLPNNKSAILLADHPTPEEMNKYLEKLLQNDKLYDQHLEHKTKQLITNQRLIKELGSKKSVLDVLLDFNCLICKVLHDKRKGNFKVNVVSYKHCDCPKPVSALQLSSNPNNDWVTIWNDSKQKAEKLYKKIMNQL